jgi:hypothetical protein
MRTGFEGRPCSWRLARRTTVRLPRADNGLSAAGSSFGWRWSGRDAARCCCGTGYGPLPLSHCWVVVDLLDGCLASLGPFRMRVITFRFGARLRDLDRFSHICTATGVISLGFSPGRDSLVLGRSALLDIFSRPVSSLPFFWLQFQGCLYRQFGVAAVCHDPCPSETNLCVYFGATQV